RCQKRTIRCTSTVDTGKIPIGASNHARKTTLPSISKLQMQYVYRRSGFICFGKAMMDLFFEQYSLDELAHMSLNDLTDYLRAKGKNRFEDPEKIAKMIQKAAQSSYRLDKVVEDSIDTILATSITVIRTFEKQIKELDKSIKRIMAGMTQTLESIPGIG